MQIPIGQIPNDADINLSCEVNIINAQTEIIEESSNSQVAVESNESDDILIESYNIYNVLLRTFTSPKFERP